MAIGIQNYDNIHPSDSDYPNGDIKDNTGAGDGTPVNRETYADIHQLLAKLMRICSLTPNGLPDNEYNGFQYLAAARRAIGPHGKTRYFGGASASNIITPELNPIIGYEPTAAAGHVCSMSAPDDDEEYHLRSITITNASANAVTVVSTEGYPVNFSTAGTTTVAAGTTKTFFFDGLTGPQWIEG